MRPLLLIMIILFTSSGGASGNNCVVSSIEKFATDFASAFRNGNISGLSNGYCATSSIHVVIEHSLTENQIEETNVQSFPELEAWLEKQKHEGLPAPNLWPFIGCRANVCAFGGNDANQLHNHLFLKSIEYNAVKGGAVITSITLEDGD